MIGTELLQLMQGDPLAQMRQQMGGPNPNPQAPPPAAAPMPLVNQPTVQRAPGVHPVVGGQPLPGTVTPATPAEQRGAQVGPAPQGAPPAPGPAAAPPNPLPQSGPPSVASQSPPDLVSLYTRLMQQQRSGSAIDHGLALMASAYAAPGTQGQIMHSMDNQQPDASSMMNNLVQLQQMQNLQNLPQPGGGAAAGAGGASTGGMDPRTWALLPPDAKLKIIEQNAQSGLQIQQQGAEEKQKDLLDAQQKAPAALQQMNDMDSIANQLKDGPMNAALKSILASPTAKIAAEKILETDPSKEPWDVTKNYVYANMLSSDQLQALQQLKKLDAQVYSDAFQSTGSRRTQQEVQNLKGGISTLMNFTQGPDAYMSQFNDFQNNLHKTMANTYGAAGRVDEIPDAIKWDASDPKNPKPMVDSAYLPNGDRYAGKGGQWASSPPKAQGGGGQPVQISGPSDIAKLPHGQPFIIPSGPNQGKIGYAQ